MWNSLCELEPDAVIEGFEGDLLLICLDSSCEFNSELQEKLRRMVVRHPEDDGEDFSVALTPSKTHADLHSRLGVQVLPAILHFADSEEQAREESMDDVIEYLEDYLQSRRRA